MSDYTTTNRRFRPVKCTEDEMKSRSPIEGYVYFTTDTNRIFCVSGNEFVPMGGNSGVYYGKREFAESEKNTGETDFVFQIATDIEGNQTPNLDDLILNIPDGGFYRVIDVYGAQLTGRRLAVSGSGGGDGSGGGGSSTSKPIINPVDKGTLYYVLSDTDNMKIKYTVTSPLDDGNNYVATIKYFFGQTDNPEESVYYRFGDVITFDVSKHLSSFSTTNRNTLQIEVTDAYGNKAIKQSIYFYLVELTLSSDASAISKINKGSTTPYFYPCKPKGGTGLQNLYIDLNLSPLDNPGQIIYSEQKPITNVNTNYNFEINIGNDENVEHGVYLLTSKFCGMIPGTTKVIPSNELQVQIAVFDPEVGTPLIATNFTGGSIAQYEKFTMQYMIIDESTLVEVKPKIYYGLSFSEEVAVLNQMNTWDHVFIEPGTYDISIEYEGAPVELGTLKVNAYEGDVPVIDASSAELYLTALGKSNSQADKEVWESKGKRAKFENFLWGTENGWITNEKYETALKLTNGAKLTIPDYSPFATEATENGLTIELDFMFSGVLDYSKPLIHCLSQYQDAEGTSTIRTGFHITGQKATLNSRDIKATLVAIGGEEDEEGNINEQDMALQAFTQYFNEDTRIHLTYVIERVPDYSLVGNNFYFVYTYLNGVISGIMKLEVDAANQDADSFKDQPGAPSILTFDSTFGDIYIYNIRVYRNALDMRTVINNYIADLTDIEEKVALYKDNNIFTADGYINIKAIQDLSYSCGVPYVLLNGGNPMEKKFKDPFAFNETYKLPVTKSDYRLMSLKMYDVNEKTGETYLAIDVPINCVNSEDESEVVTKFDDFNEGTSYLPKRGVQVYGQGTSSMVYPVKNLRLKFVEENDYPQVYNGAYPVEIVCFKADFMDSSSSHNTCTGNLVYDLYQALNMKTPPQQFKTENNKMEGVAEYDLVTAIKGFPIICFYAEGDSTNYTYIGRYNFNLDKATPEPFGFIPQWFYTGETVTDENGVARKVVKSCGLKTELINGKTVLPLDEEGKEIERDIVQCWEILNNDNGSPTKFLKLQEFNTFRESLTTEHNWTNYYEDRYPDAMVSGAKWLLGDEDEDEYPNLDEDLENGIFRVASWINSTATSEATNSSLGQDVYYQTMDTSWNRDKTYYNRDGSVFEVVSTDEVTLEDTSPSAEEDSIFLALNVSKETFIAYVGAGNYDSYAFLYSVEEGVETGHWYLDGELVENLGAYGIRLTLKTDKTLVNGTSVTVKYFETNNWSSSLYDKYDTDNAAYRLSKFKTEFTQYFNLDYATFYYVLTLTLLMMDSRAKNMMLASWDQTIWYPIFYDMDTMLGVNNTGFNKFSFDTEDDPADKVFNGFDSVLWNNFKTCFPTQIANFYARMRSTMTLEKLLRTYNEEGGDAWNEAMCSSDAWYKYERPFEEGYYDGKEGKEIARGTVSYLYAAQGRRSNHRAWWLTNRLNYLDSKFIPTTYGNEKPSQVDTFSFRAYALPEQQSTSAAEECVKVVPANHKFQLKALNNSYQSLFIGNIVYGPEYTLAGQTVELGPNEVKHEVESYILNPELIADLGDLSDKYIGSLNFPGVQTRLTELKFGRSSRSHPFSHEAYYNKLLSALNIGSSCPYLQKVNIANCTGLKTVSFAECSRLQELDAEGCVLTQITFPANSILQKLYLPDTLQTLTLTNQPYLETIKFDTSAKGLGAIILDEVPNYDSYQLVKQVYSVATSTATKGFYLTDINWTITDQQEAMNGNALEGIDILDILASNKAYPARDKYTKAQSLTGVITIAISNCTVNEYEIYSKYKVLFPNVDIRYDTSKVSLKAAPKIIFNTDSDPEKAVLHYEVKADKVNNLGFLTSAQGPTGQAIRTPSKASSQSHTFEFTGYWIDQNGIKYYLDTVTEPEAGAVRFATFVPEQDMTFYPDYTPHKRFYQVKFFDWNGNVVKQRKETSGADGLAIVEYVDAWLVEYDTKYDGPMTNFLYRPDPADWTDKRYGFVGWTGVNYGDVTVINPVTIDPTNLIVTGPVTLYPYYQSESVYEVPSNPDYFVVEGGQVKLRTQYKTTLAGKVTIPDMPGATSIGDFSESTSITDIFFLRNSTAYNKIERGAFQNSKALKNVELPASITSIGNNAFEQCFNLKTINLDHITSIGDSAFAGSTQTTLQVEVNELPDGLLHIGQNAFWNGGPNVIVTRLPDAIVDIPSSLFTFCPNVKITEFGSNDGTGHQLRSIGNNAFYQAGGGQIGDPITKIVINSTVTSIDVKAFYRYAATTLTNAYFINDESTYNINASEMGLSATGKVAIVFSADPNQI